ncbi:helix-turn-helix transcriptional regulator [Pedobacter chitinilyticus]|uniref:AraC family transcriptional regulator n=1 Tax=Pedobacter chitinilyticus TaxID=2233776 RepID=A0A3S3QG17_9SPHI|nr:helix-turn-helix transcriptional regulator [Pedobacter chitinilyticus]RWU08153.1 AraC family transcriptional regulator [Pedobacter chitinilyticus]
MKSVWDHITALHDHVLSHLDDRLSLTDLAKKFNISASTMRKQFQKQYHISLYRFIQQNRMEKALLLLREGKLTIGEVGVAVGYFEPANFTNAFIKYYGLSPKHANEIRLPNSAQAS